MAAGAAGSAIAAASALGTILRTAHGGARPPHAAALGAGGADFFVSGELVDESTAAVGSAAGAAGGLNGGGAAAAAAAAGGGKTTSGPYFRQTYGNGTLCELTGAPRETEVRIYCALHQPSHVSAIKEVSTCRYVVELHSPALCAHPAFSRASLGRDAPPVDIRCEPEPPPAAAGGAEPADSDAAATGDGARAGLAWWQQAHAQGKQQWLRLWAQEQQQLVHARDGALAARASSSADTGAPAEGVGVSGRPLRLGQCVVHARLRYRAVVIGADPSCEMPDAWAEAHGVHLLARGRAQPFYHLLVDERDGYVATSSAKSPARPHG